MSNLETRIRELQFDLDQALGDIAYHRSRLETSPKRMHEEIERDLSIARRRAGTLELELKRCKRQLADDEAQRQQRKEARDSRHHLTEEFEKAKLELADAREAYRQSPSENGPLVRVDVARRKLKELEARLAAD